MLLKQFDGVQFLDRIEADRSYPIGVGTSNQAKTALWKPRVPRATPVDLGALAVFDTTTGIASDNHRSAGLVVSGPGRVGEAPVSHTLYHIVGFAGSADAHLSVYFVVGTLKDLTTGVAIATMRDQQVLGADMYGSGGNRVAAHINRVVAAKPFGAVSGDESASNHYEGDLVFGVVWHNDKNATVTDAKFANFSVRRYSQQVSYVDPSR